MDVDDIYFTGDDYQALCPRCEPPEICDYDDYRTPSDVDYLIFKCRSCDGRFPFRRDDLPPQQILDYA